MTKVNLGSFKVDALSKEEVITQIKSKLLKSAEPNILVTPNAGHLTSIFGNPELSEIYSAAELSLIDGWPIAVAAKNASKLKITRVTGSDLLPELFSQLTKGVRVGIVGGNNESLIRQSLESIFPDLNIQIIDTSQWTNSVYDIRRLRELVQYNALSIVLLCLGHPKQELLAKELKDYDATIDFLIGEQKRAPKVFQKIGLEWFFRLITNPKKFTQRYLNAVIPSLKLIFKSFGMRRFN